LNDIVNPLKKLSFTNQIVNKTVSVSETINEIIQKQKPINLFLEKFEQNYENRENYKNKDILNNYGAYQDYSNSTIIKIIIK